MDRVLWTEKSFNNDYLSGTLSKTANNKILVSGIVKLLNINKLMYWAPGRVEDRLSFSGYGLPFPNPDIAFGNAKNSGITEINNLNRFEFTIDYPSAYYVGLGTLYMPPHVNIKLMNSDGTVNEKTVTIKIDDGIPFRSLTHPAPPGKAARLGPEFYATKWHGARTQQEILEARGFPDKNIMPDNFWGTAPPQ